MRFEPPLIAPGINVICCDYFDTIVSRIICPEDVKKQWAARLVSMLNVGIDGAGLYARRAKLEIELCERNHAAGNDLEFNILECYELLWKQLADGEFPTLQDFILLCQELELSIECQVQRIDRPIINWLQALVASGRKVILVSDFYFPESLFRRMLEFHEIEQLFSYVYVSADRLLTKRSGRIFPRLIDDLDTSSSEMMMIGDNIEADYNQPMKHKITAVQLDRSDRHREYMELSKVSGNRSLIVSGVARILGADKDKPFPELALTLFCFTEKLYFSLIEKGVQDVFFLAREGQFLKKLFDIYQESRNLSTRLRVKSHYIQVSRRSTFLPSLGPLETEQFETLFRQYRKISTKDFLLNLGLEALLPRLEDDFPGYNLSAREDDFPTSEIFQSLKKNSYFQAEYENRRLSERRAFLTYVDTFERKASSEALCIVDVGWKGTIQDNIRRLFNQESVESGGSTYSIIGLYLGLVAPGEARDGNQKYGLLFSALAGWTPEYTIFNENRALFEVVLAANHGSAASYVGGEHAGEVVLSPFAEKPLFLSQIAPLQKWLLSYFEDVNSLLSQKYYDSQWLLEYAAQQHARMVYKPTRQELNWFVDVYHVENFGVFENSTFHAGSKGRGFISKLKFTWALFRRRNHVDLGFWPLLTCLHRGGYLTAWCYRMYRNWTLFGPFSTKNTER